MWGEQRKHLEFLLQFRPAYKGSLDKTRTSVVLFPGLQRIFLKAMTSVESHVTSLVGMVPRGTTEEFCLASISCLEESVSQLSLSSWH